MSTSATSTWFWNTSRDGECTTTLGSLYQCLTALSIIFFSSVMPSQFPMAQPEVNSSYPVISYLGKEMQWTHPMWLMAQKGEETPCTPRVSSRWGHGSHVLLQFPHFHAQLQSVTLHCWWPLVCHLGKAHPEVPAHLSAQPGSWAVFHSQCWAEQVMGEEAGSGAALLCQVVNPSGVPHTTGSVTPSAASLASRAHFSVLRIPQGSHVYSLFFQGQPM